MINSPSVTVSTYIYITDVDIDIHCNLLSSLLMKESTYSILSSSYIGTFMLSDINNYYIQIVQKSWDFMNYQLVKKLNHWDSGIVYGNQLKGNANYLSFYTHNSIITNIGNN